MIATFLRIIREEARREDPAHPPRSVGVVFVHGIGSQPQSSTLREFAAPLLDYLREWHRTRGNPDWQPLAAKLSYGDKLEGPARMYLAIPAHERGATHWPPRSFIFAEGWWGSRLDPPSFMLMIAWSFGTLSRVVLTLLRQMLSRIVFLVAGGGSSESDPGKLAALVEVSSAIGFMVLYVVGMALGYVALVPLFVLARIPIEAVQEFILVKVLKPLLVENIGDFQTYVHDEVQALNIRTGVWDAIRALIEEGCEQICVVAHSQGAVVAFDAVCSLASEDPAAATHVRKLITFGGALNRAFTEPHVPARLKAGLPPHVFWLDIWSQYDPVAGGYLQRRPAVPPMVDPSNAFRQRMGWTAAPGKRHRDGPLGDQVTNSLNPVTDHGGYFQNPEQFANRVLAEIEDPSEYYKTSRFFLPHDRAERVRRRRTRISVLAGWRLVAIASLAFALFERGGARLSADARALLQLFPADSFVKDLLTAPGAFFDVVGAALDRSGTEVALLAPGVVADAISTLRAFWKDVAWSDLVLASLAYAAAFAAVHWLLLRAFYVPWDSRERAEAVAERVPTARLRGLLIALRTLLVLVLFVEAVLAVRAL